MSAPLAPSAVLAVIMRPWLWPTAVAVGLALARPGWWRRWPPDPVPDPAYLRFRLQTMYGGAGEGHPAPGDVVGYLKWCRRLRSLSR